MIRGEIWLLNFDPTVGSEIKKNRPAVIVSNDAVGILPLKIVAPITDWKDRYSQYVWMVKITNNTQNNLSKVLAIDTLQIRCVAQERFIRKLGVLNATDLQSLNAALTLTLDLS